MRPRRNRSSTGAGSLGRTCEFLVHTWRGKWPPRPPTPSRRWTPSANSAPKACGHSGITTAPACKAWAAPANPQCTPGVVTAGIPPAPPVGFQRYMVYRCCGVALWTRCVQSTRATIYIAIGLGVPRVSRVPCSFRGFPSFFCAVLSCRPPCVLYTRRRRDVFKQIETGNARHSTGLLSKKTDLDCDV